MTWDERTLLDSFVQSIAAFEFDSPHAETRMAEKGISREEINQTIQAGLPIELNNIAWYDIRAVIRGPSYEPGFDCSVVVSLSRRVVITAWRNRVEDTHSSLTLHNKTWNVSVKQILDTLQTCVVI